LSLAFSEEQNLPRGEGQCSIDKGRTPCTSKYERKRRWLFVEVALLGKEDGREKSENDRF